MQQTDDKFVHGRILHRDVHRLSAANPQPRQSHLLSGFVILLRTNPQAAGRRDQAFASHFRVAWKPRLRVPTSAVPKASALPSSPKVPEKPLLTSCPPDSGRTNGSSNGVCRLVRRCPFQVPSPTV